MEGAGLTFQLSVGPRTYSYSTQQNSLLRNVSMFSSYLASDKCMQHCGQPWTTQKLDMHSVSKRFK